MISREQQVGDSQPLPHDITVAELSAVLASAHLPLHEWGQGPAKTVQHLQKEIAEGDSQVSVDAFGNIQRKVSVVWVDVLHCDPNGDVYLLKEERQAYKDGRERRRDSLPASLGEKIKPGEDEIGAVYRALREEIGVEDVTQHHATSAASELYTPDSYPGLESQYNTSTHVVVISPDSFVPEGYVEDQADKINYYTWQKIHDAS